VLGRGYFTTAGLAASRKSCYKHALRHALAVTPSMQFDNAVGGLKGVPTPAQEGKGYSHAHGKQTH
jgi:hypothetical protein